MDLAWLGLAWAVIVAGGVVLYAAYRAPRRAIEDLYPATDCPHERASDEMHCMTCPLSWDVNDPHPPHCPFMVAAHMQERKR